MFKTNLVFEGSKRPVSFFDDDTISVVRQHISRVVDIHPDRLFVLIGIRLSRAYYSQDIRNWEVLFNRLSLNGMPIERETFHAYCSSLRVPAVRIPYKKYSKEEWMSKPAELQEIFDPSGEFTEYRILGVEAMRSYCLPLEFDDVANKIPSAQYPIPEDGQLFLNLHKDVVGILAIEHREAPSAYFPLLRSSTPQRLSADQIKALESNTAHLADLLALDPPPPETVKILKASWYIDLVDTDFGDAVRTKFEQIFYGLTVSEQVPCITFFTGKNEVSRHKFYKETAKTRSPFLELPIWSNWWTKSRPARPRPTLILYRGETRESFDRISISATDINFVAYRDATNTKGVDELKADLIAWFQSFDAVVPFVKESDISDSRFVLQEIKFEAGYSKPLEEFNTLRLQCMTGIFEESRIEHEKFRFLRSYNETDGINQRDLEVINLFKDKPFLTVEDVEQNLGLPKDESARLLAEVRQKLEDNPGLLTKQFRGYPILEIHQKNVRVSSADSVDRYLKYVNILRYILSDPTSKELDRVCPKRLETTEVVVSTVNTEFADDEFAGLFDYLKEEPEKEAEVSKEPVKRKTVSYGQFNKRLYEFDPKTFGPTSNYPKICDKSHQPIALSDQEMAELMDDPAKAKYNPKDYPKENQMKWEDPDGILLCPDYWCMYDKIPLRESELEELDGQLVCPICHGKIRTAKYEKSDIREYSVIPRAKKHNYPKLKSDISPVNLKQLPCCFKTANERKLKVDDTDGKYYILGETKSVEALRLAYVPLTLLNSLHLEETYALALEAKNRIQTGMSGFYRVGIGRPSVGLPILLHKNVVVQSPRNAVPDIIRCSFTSLWTELREEHLPDIEKLLDMKPFSDCEVARKHMARVISGIDDAFINNKLTPVQELEYTGIVLKLDLYRINLDTNTLGCTFYTPQVKKRTLGAIILQSGNALDCLCFVTRTQKKYQYRANIFEPPFDRNPETYAKLTEWRSAACVTAIPTLANAVKIMADASEEDFSIVLDPFGRGQALYIPNRVVLPFQNTPIPPISSKPKISGFSELKDLPSHKDMVKVLKEAQKVAPGYEWSEDIFDGKGHLVEILTRSGLRIPVKPESGEGQAGEVTHTIIKQGETSLALGKHNTVDMQKYKEITYASELYEFLIFQLTKDITRITTLKRILNEVNPSRKQLEPPLSRWFDKTTFFVASHSPIEFLSKIRKPCGQFTNKDVCESGHMCAWDGDTCRIQVRDTFSKQKLFNKLLGTLLENSKTRAMVLDGRTTPFFSTVLYLELPNEIVMTDQDIKSFTQESQA